MTSDRRIGKVGKVGTFDEIVHQTKELTDKQSINLFYKEVGKHIIEGKTKEMMHERNFYRKEEEFDMFVKNSIEMIKMARRMGVYPEEMKRDGIDGFME